MKKDFCLIAGLHCDELYDLEYFPQKFGFVRESIKGKSMKGKGKVKTAPKKATKKVSVTCAELERAFKECKDEDDALKMGLVYFPKGVLIEAKSNKIKMMTRNNQGVVKKGKDPGGATKGLVMPFRYNLLAYEKIAQLEKPLRYCKMTDPGTILRILRWSTKNKQLIHEQVQINVIVMAGDKWHVVGIREIVPTEAERSSSYWTWGYDAMGEEGKGGEAEGLRWKKIMGGVEEVGFQELEGNVGLESPTNHTSMQKSKVLLIMMLLFTHMRVSRLEQRGKIHYTKLKNHCVQLLEINNVFLENDNEIGSNLLYVVRCSLKHVEGGEGETLIHRVSQRVPQQNNVSIKNFELLIKLND
ncbi:N-lysine methyltransferase setd6 [Pyrus ussuriensis x Pyrus communis]|uniref:N-lysine methyltransferase setd6 n=1 Tax=Pyrus ussuriensis x Pyrus communis TaxID=2448454 RepID=A0A5N5HXK4_9ROSA|nr:N-lysine methyltransferase setd6 [Pyrus ussuriensis x Pyrus communis]